MIRKIYVKQIMNASIAWNILNFIMLKKNKKWNTSNETKEVWVISSKIVVHVSATQLKYVIGMIDTHT